MRSVDTNVLIRVWIDDDPKQSAAVVALLSSETVWISRTVLLEAAWVLGSLYKYDPPAICNAFRSLLAFPNIRVENAPSVAAALALCDRGIEIADALHLCIRPPGATFVTFDEALVKRARRAGVTGIERP